MKNLHTLREVFQAGWDSGADDPPLTDRQIERLAFLLCPALIVRGSAPGKQGACKSIAEPAKVASDTLPRLLTTKEVAEILGRHEKTVLELVKRGKLGCIRQSARSVQYTEKHVADYLASCEVPAVTAEGAPEKPKRNPRRRYVS